MLVFRYELDTRKLIDSFKRKSQFFIYTYDDDLQVCNSKEFYVYLLIIMYERDRKWQVIFKEKALTRLVSVEVIIHLLQLN